MANQSGSFDECRYHNDWASGGSSAPAGKPKTPMGNLRDESADLQNEIANLLAVARAMRKLARRDDDAVASGFAQQLEEQVERLRMGPKSLSPASR